MMGWDVNNPNNVLIKLLVFYIVSMEKSHINIWHKVYTFYYLNGLSVERGRDRKKEGSIPLPSLSYHFPLNSSRAVISLSTPHLRADHKLWTFHFVYMLHLLQKLVLICM